MARNFWKYWITFGWYYFKWGYPLKIKSDVKRPEMLREFVALVEDEFNGIHFKSKGNWLLFEIENMLRHLILIIRICILPCFLKWIRLMTCRMRKFTRSCLILLIQTLDWRHIPNCDWSQNIYAIFLYKQT